MLDERDSVTETILPIVAKKTLKVFNAEEVKGEKSEVRAHSIYWQQWVVKNSYPVQGILIPLDPKSNQGTRQMITVRLIGGYRIRLIDISKT